MTPGHQEQSPAIRPGSIARTPRVLVLMATLNGVRWIDEQIDSVLGQRDVEVSLEISDDASSDGTEVLLQQRCAADRRVRLHRQPLPSGSAAANFVTLIASTACAGFDYVALADQDDIWLPHKLSKACEALSEGRGGGYSAAVHVGTSDSMKIQVQCAALTAADFLFEGAGQGCTFVLSIAFFERVQSFLRDHRDAVAGFHFHDWLVYLLARAWDVAWRFDPEPSMWYRQHSANEIGARGTWHSVRWRWRKIADGWYRAQTLKASQLYELAGGRAEVTMKIIALLRAEPGFGRSVLLGWTSLSHSRRRRGDRLVVAAAAFAGLL